MAAGESAQGCSAACRAVHVPCRGCGVLSGPEHDHVLSGGFCTALVIREAGRLPVRVPLYRACADVLAPCVEGALPRTSAPLRALREARGLSRRELAARCGMSAHTLARLEEARHRPRPATLARLAAALGLAPADLEDFVA